MDTGNAVKGGVLQGWGVVYSPPGGMGIEDAAKALVQQAATEREWLVAAFNGVYLRVMPGDTAQDVEDAYWRAHNLRSGMTPVLKDATWP